MAAVRRAWERLSTLQVQRSFVWTCCSSTLNQALTVSIGTRARSASSKMNGTSGEPMWSRKKSVFVAMRNTACVLCTVVYVLAHKWR